MTHQQIRDRVAVIVAETLGFDSVTLEDRTTAADVEGWDSLANVQIIVGVERAFGIRLRTGEIAAIRNVGELVARIRERTNAPSRS
jgi:acyl carrier protein